MSNIKFTPGKFDGMPWKADDNPNLQALIYLDVVDQVGSLAGWVTPEVAKLVKDAPEMLALLRSIFHEYDQTYDADQDSNGAWTAAASVPVEVMERVRTLVGKHK